MRRVVVSALLTAGCALLALTAAGRVAAAPVAPGATGVAIDNSGFVAPTGDLLDSSSQTLTLSFVDPTVPTPTDVDVTFNTQVLRDPATQRLTFVYSFDQTGATFPTLANVTSALTLAAFGTFATDVTSDTALNVDRSADGSTITATTNAGDAVQLPTIAIATDATAFDNNGSASGSVNGEVPSPETGTTPISAQFSVANTFQPVVDTGGGGGGGGGGAAIPLPAGVWFGLVALAGGGAFKRFGRKLHLA